MRTNSEESAIEEGPVVEHALRDLHEAGLGIAIDRFNSGLSSLKRLRELPLAALKIDSSCVTAAADDEAAASLVTGIIGYATALGVPAVAEGIETEAQRRFLVASRVARRVAGMEPASRAEQRKCWTASERFFTRFSSVPSSGRCGSKRRVVSSFVRRFGPRPRWT